MGESVRSGVGVGVSRGMGRLVGEGEGVAVAAVGAGVDVAGDAIASVPVGVAGAAMAVAVGVPGTAVKVDAAPDSGVETSGPSSCLWQPTIASTRASASKVENNMGFIAIIKRALCSIRHLPYTGCAARSADSGFTDSMLTEQIKPVTPCASHVNQGELTLQRFKLKQGSPDPCFLK